MNQEEIQIRLGLDSSGFNAGLGRAQQSLGGFKAGVGGQFQAAGDHAGHVFAKAFGGRLLASMGIWFAVYELAKKAKEVFLEDTAAWKAFKSYWNAPENEKEALKQGEELDKKRAEQDKKIKERRKDEKQAVQEVMDTIAKRQDDQDQLLYSLARERELTKQIAGFHGSTLERIQLIKKLEDQRNNSLEIHEKISKAKQEAEEKAERERKQAEEERIRRAEKLEDLARREADIRQDESIRLKHALDSFMPSIAELAGAGWFGPGSGWGAGFHAGPFAGIAQNIQALEQRAHNQFMGGYVQDARRSIATRNQLYDRLADIGIVPARADLDAQVRSARALEDIAHQRVRILTKPSNAK